MPSGSKAAFQGLVMRNPEDPTLKICARLILPQMMEKPQKYFLKHLLRIGNGDAKRQEIAKNRFLKTFKKRNHFVSQAGRPRLATGIRQRQINK